MLAVVCDCCYTGGLVVFLAAWIPWGGVICFGDYGFGDWW